MLGFYNYTVILTYLSVASATIGITLINNKFVGIFWAIACLMFSGFCDMFDGKVARTKKDRTDAMKKFGIQIDSLADMICFGVLPALINYKISVIEILELQGITWQRILAFISSIIYVLAALIRLAYFNVMEEERTKTTSEVRKYYEGLPVTTISIIFPTVYLLKQCVIGDEPCGILFNVLLVIVAALFVSRIPVKKLYTKGLVVVAVIGAVILLAIALTYKWPLF